MIVRRERKETIFQRAEVLLCGKAIGNRTPRSECTIQLINIHCMHNNNNDNNVLTLFLSTMDNKHYFSLYLIRIKHGLVLFSLLLTALQSLIYLLITITSKKVNQQKNEIYFS